MSECPLLNLKVVYIGHERQIQIFIFQYASSKSSSAGSFLDYYYLRMIRVVAFIVRTGD